VAGRPVRAPYQLTCCRNPKGHNTNLNTDKTSSLTPWYNTSVLSWLPHSQMWPHDDDNTSALSTLTITDFVPSYWNYITSATHKMQYQHMQTTETWDIFYMIMTVWDATWCLAVWQ